jgi:lysophospholipase L1-like esterase
MSGRALRISIALVCTACLAAGSGASALARSPYRVRGARPAFVMRAVGDSVTAGFGFFASGAAMSPLELVFCIPPAQPNDRCSSNSPNGAGHSGRVRWSSDYGLGNGVSWAAQAAHALGLSGSAAFQNLAVSGSTPADWETGGYLNPTLNQVVADDPDLTVMTLGANPLLTIFLTGKGAWCAFSLTDAQLRACVKRFIVAQRLRARLTEVVNELLAAPHNHVVVSLYHLAIPSLTLFTAQDVQILFSAFNSTITSAMRRLPSYGSRLFVISPSPFFVGRAPGSYVCPTNQAEVDGPSHQSQVTQDLLAVNPFFSFCPGEPWIISADTGIHPNPTGYAQFAAALVALVRRHGWAPASLRHSTASVRAHYGPVR